MFILYIFFFEFSLEKNLTEDDIQVLEWWTSRLNTNIFFSKHKLH